MLAVLRGEKSPPWPELGGSQHPGISQPSYPTTLLDVLESSRAALARTPSPWLSMAQFGAFAPCHCLWAVTTEQMMLSVVVADSQHVCSCACLWFCNWRKTIFVEGDWGKLCGVVSPYQGERVERCLVKCRLRKKQEHTEFIVSLCFLVAGLEGSGLLQAGALSCFMKKGSLRQPRQTKLMGCSSSPEIWRGGDRSSFLPWLTMPWEMAMAPLISRERCAWKTSPGTL